MAGGSLFRLGALVVVLSFPIGLSTLVAGSDKVAIAMFRRLLPHD